MSVACSSVPLKVRAGTTSPEVISMHFVEGAKDSGDDVDLKLDSAPRVGT